MSSSSSSGVTSEKSFISLEGMPHTLTNGEWIYAVDHGGTGAVVWVGVYRQKSNAVEVHWRVKFPRELSPSEVLERMEKDAGHKRRADRVVYGYAAPICKNRAAAGVNVPHAIDGNHLSSRLDKQPPVQVLNDYALVAWGLARPLGEDDQVVLQKGDSSDYSPGDPYSLTAIGPGSGCGVSYLDYRNTGGHRVKALEGSHGSLEIISDRSPDDKLLIKFYKWLGNYGAINSDMVLCGQGLVMIFRFLANGKAYHVPEELISLLDWHRDGDHDLAHENRVLLTEHALGPNKIDICEETFRIFMRLLGAFFQKTAFLHQEVGTFYQMAMGGGVPAGMIATHAEDFVSHYGPDFLQEFLNVRVGADRKRLSKIPIRILRYPRDVALRGAVFAAACMQL